MRFRDDKMHRIKVLVHGKYQCFSYVCRDWNTNRYDIELAVYGYELANTEHVVLIHKEPAEGFPSDHLMTKLLLLVG